MDGKGRSDRFLLGWMAYFQVRNVCFREGYPLPIENESKAFKICSCVFDVLPYMFPYVWGNKWSISYLIALCMVYFDSFHYMCDCKAPPSCTFWQQKARQYPPRSSSSLKVGAVTTKDVSSCPALIYITTTLPPSSYSNIKGPKISHTKPAFA